MPFNAICEVPPKSAVLYSNIVSCDEMKPNDKSHAVRCDGNRTLPRRAASMSTSAVVICQKLKSMSRHALRKQMPHSSRARSLTQHIDDHDRLPVVFLSAAVWMGDDSPVGDPDLWNETSVSVVDKRLNDGSGVNAKAQLHREVFPAEPLRWEATEDGTTVSDQLDVNADPNRCPISGDCSKTDRKLKSGVENGIVTMQGWEWKAETVRPFASYLSRWSRHWQIKVLQCYRCGIFMYIRMHMYIFACVGVFTCVM